MARKTEAEVVMWRNCTGDAETSRSTYRVEVTIVSQSPFAAEVEKHQEGKETQGLAEGHYCAAAAAARSDHCFQHSSVCEHPMDSCCTTSECRHP